MALGRHPNGYILKELLLPFIKKNYVWVTVNETEYGTCFEENKKYLIHTMCGYTLPSYMSINIETVRTRRNGTFVSFIHKQKRFSQKVKTTLFGNKVIKFDKYYISGGSKVKRLLYTREYVSLMRNKNLSEHDIQ